MAFGKPHEPNFCLKTPIKAFESQNNSNFDHALVISSKFFDRNHFHLPNENRVDYFNDDDIFGSKHQTFFTFALKFAKKKRRHRQWL